MTIGPRQFKSCSNLVHVSFKESEDPGESPSAMTPLVVVIVDENKSAKSCHKIPAFAEVFQVRQLLSRVLTYHISQIHAILELCYPTEFRMMVNSVYGLANQDCVLSLGLWTPNCRKHLNAKRFVL